MQIVYTPGRGYSDAPSWLPSVLAEVAAFYDKTFTNDVTIDVTVNWENLGQGFLAENDGPTTNESFSTVRAALIAHAQTAVQSAAYTHLPTGVDTVQLGLAEAQALGIGTVTSTIELDVSSRVDWSQFDAFAAIAHEISETAMGRFSNAGAPATVMDLFRFSAAGQHDLTGGDATSNATAYFSVNDGKTSLGVWNNDVNNDYDLGDWVVSGYPDANDPNGAPVANDAYGTQGGGVAPISEADIELMQVIGWSTDIVTSGERLAVASGVTSSGFTVMDGGSTVISSGGIAEDFWYTNATAIDDGVVAPGASGGAGGATAYVVEGGVEKSATLDAGGVEVVAPGGRADASLVLAGGVIDDSGLTSGAVLSGGREDVLHDGESEATSVRSGGLLAVSSGGAASDTSVAGGGSEIVSAGGRLSMDGVVVSAGMVVRQGVQSGGSQFGATLLSGSMLETPGLVVLGGGVDLIGVSGSATGNLLRGGHEHIGAGGVAEGTLVSAGGAQYVTLGGSAAGTRVLSSGTMYVSHGGSVSGVTISDGGALDVSSSAAISQATVHAGGAVVWTGAGSSTIAGALSGGGRLVEDGPGTLVVRATAAAFTGEMLVSGGVVELAAAGGLGAGRLGFAGVASETLEIAAADRPVSGATFATTLLDFDNATRDVELAGLAYVSGASASLSGDTLTLHDGAYATAFKLGGALASKYMVVSDGAGSLEIHAVAGGAAEAPVLAQAIAALAPQAAPAGLSAPTNGRAGVQVASLVHWAGAALNHASID